jgi:multidrug resistance efflux pump
MEEKVKTGKETIEFQDQQNEIENLRSELAKSKEELEKSKEELERSKEEAARYLRWWQEGNGEKEKLQDKLNVLLTKMDKVAAVAGLYISSKAWK